MFVFTSKAQKHISIQGIYSKWNNSSFAIEVALEKIMKFHKRNAALAFILGTVKFMKIIMMDSFLWNSSPTQNFAPYF